MKLQAMSPSQIIIRILGEESGFVKTFRTRWGLLALIFAGYVPLASQSPYPIIVYFVGNFRPHLSHFRGQKCNFRDCNLVNFYLCITLSIV